MYFNNLKLHLFVNLIILIGNLHGQNSNIDSLRIVIPNGHNAPIVSAQINSKLQYIISAAYDNKIIIWDIKSQKELLDFNGHSDMILTFGLAEGENQVLSSDLSGDFFVWNLHNGKIVFSRRDLGLISSICYVPKSRVAFLASEKGCLYEYSFTSNSLIDSVPLFTNIMGQITTEFIADKELIIAFKEYSDEINIFSLKSKKSDVILHTNIDKIKNVIYDKKRDNLIVLDGDNFIHIFNIYSGLHIKNFASGNSKLNCVTKNGDFGIIVGNNYGELIFFDTNLNVTNKKKVSNESIVFVSPTAKLNEYILISQKSNYEIKPGKTPIRMSFLDIIRTDEDSIFSHREFSQPITNVFINDDLTCLLAGSDDYFIYYLNLSNYLYSFFKGKTEYHSSDDLKTKDMNLFKAQTSQGFIYYNSENCKLVYDYDGALVLYGIRTENVYRSTYLNPHNKFINHFKISFDGSFVYLVYDGKDDRDIMDIFSGKSKKLVKRIMFKNNEYCSEAIFSADGNFIYVIITDAVFVYDVKSFKIVKRIDFNGNFISHIDVSKSKGLICIAEENQFYLYNAHFELINKIQIIGDISDVIFSNSGHYLAVSSDDGVLTLYNCYSNDLIVKKMIFEGRISETLFGDNETMIFFKAFDDNLTRIFSIKHQEIILDYLDFQNGEWFLKLLYSPYYMCSKGASKNIHYVTPNLKIIGFEQLDPIYNRPDIVLDSIANYFGDMDRQLVSMYHAAWEKRIDYLGLDQNQLTNSEIIVPEAEIVGANDIAYENKEGKITIKIKANDPKYPLRRFNVFVNEVPLYGSTGISIAHLKKQQWDTTLSLLLSLGENKIQVSVMNEIGLESFKYPTYVRYTSVKEIVAKTHYIGIGVNEFKQPGHNLNYCVNDINDLATAFAGKNTVAKIFINQKVTRENVLKLKQYLKDSTTVNDKVIISCSSHGLLDDSLNFYLATHDIDFKSPKSQGLKYEELEGLLDDIPARQKLLLLDACNSGENDKTELLKQDLVKNKYKMDSNEVEGAKGIIIKLEGEYKSNFQKMNQLFVNVRNNTGSVIISAAGGQESALESIEVNGQKIENGAFTYSILEFLKANNNNSSELTVNKLKQYVESRVEQITNGNQKPTSRQETMEVDWKVR